MENLDIYRLFDLLTKDLSVQLIKDSTPNKEHQYLIRFILDDIVHEWKIVYSQPYFMTFWNGYTLGWLKQKDMEKLLIKIMPLINQTKETLDIYHEMLDLINYWKDSNNEQ